MDADDLAERLKAAEEAPLREDGEELWVIKETR